MPLNRQCLLATTLAFAILGTVSLRVVADDSVEYAVKAAYLSKFGIYVTWPDATFRTSDDPLNICIVGQDPFGAALDQAILDKSIDAHPIHVQRVSAYDPVPVCHILYVNDDDDYIEQGVLESARGRAILTVTDGRGDLPPSGVVDFVVVDNRVRFTIDRDAAQQNGLKIGSKLLQLALNVKQASAGAPP